MPFHAKNDGLDRWPAREEGRCPFRSGRQLHGHEGDQNHPHRQRMHHSGQGPHPRRRTGLADFGALLDKKDDFPI